MKFLLLLLLAGCSSGTPAPGPSTIPSPEGYTVREVCINGVVYYQAMHSITPALYQNGRNMAPYLRSCP